MSKVERFLSFRDKNEGSGLSPIYFALATDGKIDLHQQLEQITQGQKTELLELVEIEEIEDFEPEKHFERQKTFSNGSCFLNGNVFCESGRKRTAAILFEPKKHFWAVCQHRRYVKAHPTFIKDWKEIQRKY